MKPGGGRAKGAGGERECAQVFRAHGYDAKRSSPMQAEYPEDYCDLAGTGPFAVEVKRLSQKEAWRLVGQTREHLGKEFPGLVPLLAYRVDGGKWTACLPLEELLKLIAPVGSPARPFSMRDFGEGLRAVRRQFEETPAMTVSEAEALAKELGVAREEEGGE